MFWISCSGIWDRLGSFIYMSLFKNPYKYVVTTSMRCKSSPFKTVKQIRYLNMVVSIIREYVSS